MQPTWQRDGVTLYLGDCLEILPTLEAGSVRLLWTDPPYGHGNLNGDLQESRIGVKGARKRPPESIANDTEEDMRLALDGALTLATPLLKPDCCCCCCCCGGGGPKPTFAWVAERMDRSGLSFFHAVVWDKSARGNGLGWRFRRNYEFVMVAHRTGGRLAWADDNIAVPNITRMKPVRERLHPNEKPIGLAAQFIRWTTNLGETVLDPFMGSGTTGVACVQTGRNFIGIEIDPTYFEIAKRRIEQAMMQPRLEGV